jgi:hypothetical protein
MSVMVYVVKWRALRLGELSSREVLPCVVYVTDCDHEVSTKSGRVPLGVLRIGGKKKI